MAFWYLNKKTNKAAIFGSLAKLAEVTGLNVNTLYSHFSRKIDPNKQDLEEEYQKEIDTPDYRIVKCEIQTSKRSK